MCSLMGYDDNVQSIVVRAAKKEPVHKIKYSFSTLILAEQCRIS